MSATTIPLDLGPPGKYLDRVYSVPFTSLLQGQAMSFDLAFNNSLTIMPGLFSHYFTLNVRFETNEPGTFPGFIHGTGGIMLPGGLLQSPFGSASGNGLLGFGLFPLLERGTPPLTFYGAHFDLTLPTSDSDVTGATVEFIASPQSGFVIGQVPESGSTLFLLILALAGLQVARFRDEKPKCITTG